MFVEVDQTAARNDDVDQMCDRRSHAPPPSADRVFEQLLHFNIFRSLQSGKTLFAYYFILVLLLTLLTYGSAAGLTVEWCLESKREKREEEDAHEREKEEWVHHTEKIHFFRK